MFDRPTKSEPIVRAKGYPDFVVHRDRGTLINTNRNKLLAYKIERDKVALMHANRDKLDRLEKDVQTIKNLLTQLAERNGLS